MVTRAGQRRKLKAALVTASADDSDRAGLGDFLGELPSGGERPGQYDSGHPKA